MLFRSTCEERLRRAEERAERLELELERGAPQGMPGRLEELLQRLERPGHRLGAWLDTEASRELASLVRSLFEGGR